MIHFFLKLHLNDIHSTPEVRIISILKLFSLSKSHCYFLQRYVREALSSALGAILDCTTTDVEIQENVPRNGDLTLRVHIRGASVRRINSGALSRVEFVTDSLRRTERTLELLAVINICLFVYLFKIFPLCSQTTNLQAHGICRCCRQIPGKSFVCLKSSLV